ncbi:MAG: serine protease [Rhodospirillales bacterium]|nr:MAG: serine protease [Rhodospirillales bacterium]
MTGTISQEHGDLPSDPAPRSPRSTALLRTRFAARLKLTTAGRLAMMARLLFGVLVALILAGPSVWPGDRAALAADPTALIVNCHDPERNVVQKTRRDRCQGRIVSDAEAAEIEAARRAYIRRALTDPSPSVAPGKRLHGIGTGFFVNRDGWVLTNHHVIGNCEVVSVSSTSGESAAARVVATKSGNDLALLHVDLTPAAVARFASSRSIAGAVALVGYPDQGIAPIRPLLTNGQAVGMEQLTPTFRVIRFRADVRRGNSGGPLLDGSGNVIGVVFASINTPGVYRRTGEIVRNVGFAVPSDTAMAFLRTHHVPFGSTGGAAVAAATDGTDLLARARPFVARIGCWR